MKVLLAASKTGGHIFPALALAEEFIRQDAKSEILLVGSKEAIANKILNQHGVTWQGIDARPLKGAGLIGKLQAMLALVGGIRQATRIVRQFHPQVVVGFGGYTSASLVMAAALQKVPCFLQEQNLLPGLTNRYLGRFVKRVFTSFADSEKFFPAGRTIFMGNPVRSQITKGAADYHSFGLEPGRFTVLVFGGSQGAHNLNTKVMEAFSHVAFQDRTSFQLIHQTGERDFPLVRGFFQQQEISAYVSPFITQMAEAYAVADLVICRAGATSVSELMMTGKPSILVPYPYAANDHQTVNARYLADRGAALMIPDAELDGQRLAEQIIRLKQDVAEREKMGKQARGLAKPDAAQDMVSYLLGHKQ